MGSNEETEVGGSEIVFDKDFNFTQLLECLKDLLVLYQIKTFETDSNHILHAEQIESYAIYLIINLGNNSSIKWGFSLPVNVRNNQLIRMALTLNGLYRERNFVRFFGLFKKLPLLLKF